MKGIKNFEEYRESGVVKKITPDVNRASFLHNESAKRFDFLNDLIVKVGVKEDNANYFIENCYNIISEMLRSKMLKKGFSASGMGAHEAEISFMKILGFQDSEINFANDLRYFRNGIQYYGKKFDKDYAENVIRFTKRLFPKLKRE